MATFTKVWAVKTQFQANPGDVIEVALKRGGVNPVILGSYLYENNGEIEIALGHEQVRARGSSSFFEVRSHAARSPRSSPMSKQTKEYQLWVNYGHGWEHEVSEETLSEIRERYKEYRVNCPEYPTKIKVKNISGE